MDKPRAVKSLMEYVTVKSLAETIKLMKARAPKNEAIDLMDAALSVPNDAESIWFTALACVCVHDSKLAGAILQEATHLAGKPELNGLQKTELIYAITSGSKLTKADAGRNLDAGLESLHK